MLYAFDIMYAKWVRMHKLFMVFTVLFQRVAVVGGGYIGVELAGVFHALGSHTEYFTRADRPLKEFDDLITSTLLGEMKKQGLLHRPNQVLYYSNI